jgi:hypothetical protein
MGQFTIVPKRPRSISRTLLCSVIGLAASSLLLLGCPKTQFIDEGAGQATDRASGKAPPGSVGACKVANTQRPPIVNAQLWNNLQRCNKRTPRRYLRIGFGKALGDSAEDERRMNKILEALGRGASEPDGNVRMLSTLRTVRRQALTDERLAARVERNTGRTFACDYAYLFSTTQKQYTKLGTGGDNTCTATVYDPKLRRDVCMFSSSVAEAQWLTSAWSCLAFTETVGEGGSCYRLCAYDDFCASQVSCAQPDFDLVLCALGVCMPEKVAGIL